MSEEPKGLPPHRDNDHKIPLKDGAQPVNIGPYRYESMQKDVIEQLVKKMLNSDVIQHGTSIFFSYGVGEKERQFLAILCGL